MIHRESIVHSLVEYCDNAVLAQLGAPDMRLPIQYALTWPARAPGPAASLDLLSCPPLTFAAPDCETFECLALALQAAAQGGTAPVSYTHLDVYKRQGRGRAPSALTDR